MAKVDSSRWIELTKEFDFDAAHFLPKVADGHKCKRLHGHTYRVVIGLGGDFDQESGMLIDYADIAAAWAPLNDALDHRLLNDIPGLENPTTEVLVHWILDALLKRVADPITALIRWVRVYESSTTYAQASRHNTPVGR